MDRIEKAQNSLDEVSGFLQRGILNDLWIIELCAFLIFFTRAITPTRVSEADSRL